MAAGPVVPGLGVANLEAVRVNSNAYKSAAQQRQTTYKAQIDQANARAQQIQAQLKPLADKFEADRRGGKVSQAALQQQVATIQQMQQSGQQEVNQILAPVALSEAYVDEQIVDKLNTEIQKALTAPAVDKVVGHNGYVPDGRDASAAAEFFRKEVQDAGEAVRIAKIKPI